MNREALPPFVKPPTEAWRRLLERMGFLLSERSGIEANLMNQSPIYPLADEKLAGPENPIETQESEKKPTPQVGKEHQLAEKLTGPEKPEDLRKMIIKIEELKKKLNPEVYGKGPQYQFHFEGFKEWEFEEILNELRSILSQEQSPQKGQYYRLRALLDVALEGNKKNFKWGAKD